MIQNSKSEEIVSRKQTNKQTNKQTDTHTHTHADPVEMKSWRPSIFYSRALCRIIYVNITGRVILMYQ